MKTVKDTGMREEYKHEDLAKKLEENTLKIIRKELILFC